MVHLQVEEKEEEHGTEQLTRIVQKTTDVSTINIVFGVTYRPIFELKSCMDVSLGKLPN